MSSNNDDLLRAFASGTEEAVEVNQRGLIEKILARYSGEYTVFRELLQNADDAQASNVEIHFNTQVATVPLTQLRTELVTSIVVKNDGIVFREEDWRRLKTVADGQPSVESIGAFGVGFYSIWSLSDEPLVVSGDQMMLFFWKGQQLAVKRAKNPHNTVEAAPNGRPWSSISMPCRSPEPMPDPATFSKFLATALPFTSHITTMSVSFNGIELCSISRTPAPARPLSIPAHTNVRTPGKMMTITSLEEAPLQLTCRAKRVTLASLETPAKTLTQMVKQSFATKFLSFAASSVRTPEPAKTPEPSAPETDPLETLTASLFLRIVTAQAKLTASAAIIAEIERSTKKPPPSSCRLRVLYSSKEEADASRPEKTGSSITSLFSQLTTDLKTQGKIYIGFPLFQTTGCASAISGRFIPTVEREQIDLQAKAIADYNRELLSISGITCRIIYDNEMQDLARRWKNIKQDNTFAQSDIHEAASHLMQNFTFYQSTPIAEVGRLVQSSFFGSNTREFLVASTRGILPSSKVRLPATELSFLTGLAVVPDTVAQSTSLLLDQLQERNLIQSVTIDDVISQLNAKPLPLGQAISALQWWIGLASNLQYDARLMPRFKEALVATIPAEAKDGEEQVVPMSAMKAYLNPKSIPPDLPLPTYVLPYSISRVIPWQDLHRVFGISELSVQDWVRHLTSTSLLEEPDTSITLSSAFAERILSVLAKIWMNLRSNESASVVTMLKPLPCIPTKKGMVVPSEAYLPKVTLFEDLPVTTIVAKGSMEKLLKALGVRDHVDLQLVFSRLLGAGSWDQEQVVRLLQLMYLPSVQGSASKDGRLPCTGFNCWDLLTDSCLYQFQAKYLVSVADILSSEELDKLKKTAWLTSSDAQVEEGKRPTRYKANALYEPTEAHRKLGLPLIAWTSSKWRPQSDEAKFLFRMGLKRFPAVEDTLIMASDHTVPDRRKLALDYFLEHFEAQYASTYSPSKQDLPFVPVIKNGQKQHAKPTESFSSAGAAVMGFAILDPEYQLQANKFRLASDPPSSLLVKRLLTAPPGTHNDARPVFAYLAGQASRFTAADHNALAFARLVPVQQPDSNIWSLAFPRSVYFKSSESTIPEQFRSLFTFVDYGSTANAFLLQIGVRNEPTAAEMTQLLLDDPRKFLSLAASADRYVSLLRQIAAQAPTFPSNLRKKMQDTPFLLGYERVRPHGNVKAKKPEAVSNEEDDDEDSLLQYRLALARDIVVVDDTTLVNDFREQILTCPQDDLIEAFVENLGGRRISKLVTTSYSSTSIPEEASPRAESLRKLILERVVLFLHERPQSGKDVRLSEDWLKRNLKVREVTRIERQRTLVLGPSRIVRTSPASAAATQEKGTLLLRVSASFNDLDYYEVAAALTRLILAKQKIHDTLLFMTLLQTSLRDLKRRGFNVDKILNARKAEQEAIEQKDREARMEAERQRMSATVKQKPPPYEERQAHGSGAGALPDSQQAPPSPAAPSLPPPGPSSLFNTFRQKLRGHPMLPPTALSGEQHPPHSPRETTSLLEGSGVAGDSKREKSISRGSSSTEDVTPQANISTNVLRAIAASRPDRSGNITSQVDTKEVKESASYCDSTPANELDYVTEIAGIRFYVSRSVEPDENILQEHGEALRQYAVSVIKPVGQVFNMDPKALHIFYDKAGPLIAFNRSGSIFFNLRFHLAWHGEEMRQGNIAGALISTYFSMAHELAHNLVLPHNSEHSFYTSQIAQTYFISMAARIAEAGASTSELL